MPHTGDAPSLVKNRNFPKVLLSLIVVLLILLITPKWKTMVERWDKEGQAQGKITTEKFYLPPRDLNKECEEVPTVDVGPGTSHKLRADAPYRAISLRPDGTSKIYNMPSGWETWNGATPAGKLRLISAVDAKEKTLVEITRVR